MPELLVSGNASNLVHRRPVRLKDLGALDLAIPGASNARRRMIDAYLSANGIVVKRLLEFDTMMGTLDLVARGEWSVILPLMMMEPDIEGGRYTINPIVDPPLMLELFLLEPARKMMDEPALAFLDCLRAELERINGVAAQLMAGPARPKTPPKTMRKTARG
jgi:DNA-binding transcriptional LysR family regulator